MAYLFRSREIALQSNSRYLNALAQVDDPTCGVRALDAITTRKRSLAPRPLKVLNPLARPDNEIFETNSRPRCCCRTLMKGDRARESADTCTGFTSIA